MKRRVAKVRVSRRAPGMRIAVHESAHATIQWIVANRLGEAVGINHIAIGPRARALVRDLASRDHAKINGVMNAFHFYKSDPEIPRLVEQAADGDDLCEEDQEFLDIEKRAMVSDVLVYLAGIVAEARYRHYSTTAAILGGGMDDFENAREIATDFYPEREERGCFLDDMLKCVGRIQRQAGVWETVMALADVLLEQQMVTGDDASKIMKLAFEEHGGMLAGGVSAPR